MTDTVTREQLEHAALDAETLASIINGANTGAFVVSRLGQNLHTMAYLQSLIPALAALKTNDGGLYLEGSTAGDLPSLPRTDAQLAFTADPAGATPTKAILLGFMPDPAGEIALTGYHLLSSAAWTQSYSMFAGLTDSDNTATAYNPYVAIHGQAKVASVAFDCTPWITWPGTNAVRLCGGSTGGSPWDTPTPQNWAEVSTNLRVGAGLIAGQSGSTAPFAMKGATYGINCDGFASFGQVTAGAFTESVVVGYSSGGATAIIQGIQLATTTFIPLQVVGSTFKIVTGSSPADAITVSTARLVRFHAYGAGALSTDASGNITASDSRIKSNIRAFEASGLAIVNSIDTIIFNLDSDLAAGITVDRVGFKADDFEKGLPQAVGYWDDEQKTRNLDDRALIAVLWNAVKELNAKVETLEARAT